jgi:hypothetical protein
MHALRFSHLLCVSFLACFSFRTAFIANVVASKCHKSTLIGQYPREAVDLNIKSCSLIGAMEWNRMDIFIYIKDRHFLAYFKTNLAGNETSPLL